MAWILEGKCDKPGASFLRKGFIAPQWAFIYSLSKHFCIIIHSAIQVGIQKWHLANFFTNVFDFDVLIWNHCSNYKGKMGRRSWETQQCFQDARTKRNGANVHLRQLRSTSESRWLMSNRAGLRRTSTFSRVLENDRTCAGQASLSLLLRSLWRPWSHWNNQKLILRLSVNIY